MKRAVLSVVLVLLLGGGVLLGQDAKKTDEAGASNLETCLKRAIERAKTDAARRNSKIVRATVSPSDGREYQSYLVVVEFKDASLGFFQGGTESKTDQWVVVEKDQVPIVVDATSRVPTK